MLLNGLVLLAAGLALALTAALVVAVVPLPGGVANWLALYGVAFAQVVLLSEVLSELRQLGRGGYLVGQGVLLLLALAVWWRAGRPSLWAPLRLHVDLRALTRHPVLTLWTIMLALYLGFVCLQALRQPRPFLDAITYHLPRAIMWLDNSTARHFYTGDLRQIEFPPNASFQYTWLFALGGANPGYQLLTLPQVLAGLWLVVAVVALARVTGHSRAASLWAGCAIVPTYLFLFKLFDSEIDIITSVTTTLLLVTVVLAVDQHKRGVPLYLNSGLFHVALAFGIATGTKLTVAFLLPGAAVGLALWILLSQCTGRVRLITALMISSVAGFTLFGSYNFLLNLSSFGNPITARTNAESSDVFSDNPSANPADYTNAIVNLARYTYQIPDTALTQYLMSNHAPAWTQMPLVLPIYRTWTDTYSRVAHAHDEGYRFVVQRLNLPVERGVPFRIGTQIGTFGFNSYVYLLWLASPFALVGLLPFATRSRRVALSEVWLLIMLSWLFTLCLTNYYSAAKTRLMLIVMPPLLVALVPWLYSRQWWAIPWLLAQMMLMASVFVVAPSMIQLTREPLAQQIVEAEAQLGNIATTAGTPVIAVSAPRHPTFVYQAAAPHLTFINMPYREAEAAFARGEVRAVLGEDGILLPTPAPTEQP